MKYNMKSSVKILITLIIITLFIIPAAASGTQKEEVVYVNLNGDGTVDHVYTVNIFDMQTAGRITDYGSYYSVRNMVTTDPVNVSGDEITIDTSAGKLYYEGDLGSAPIPWDVDVTYFMDGVPYTADEIAGKSGNMEMHIVITKDPSDSGDFYKNYALMMTATLDANKCSNITAPGATMANVGSSKQLSFTILPDKGANIVIAASVVDFEMDAISINGIRLTLDVDVDTTEMEDDLVELSDGIVELDDGAWELSDGVGNLSQGVANASVGGYLIKSGAATLASGTSALSSGLTTLSGNSAALNGGADQVFDGLISTANSELAAFNITLTTTNYAQVLNAAISSPDITQAQKESLTDILNQLAAYDGFRSSLSAYTTGVDYAATNASLLYAGALNLSTGASVLSYGLGELQTGTYTLQDAMVNLTDGTGELRDNTTGLDTKFTDKINEVLDPLRGGTGNTKSYVSAKNTQVTSVQFVMHTPAVEKTEVDVPETETEEDLNLIQRVLRLFGLA